LRRPDFLTDQKAGEKSRRWARDLLSSLAQAAPCRSRGNNAFLTATVLSSSPAGLGAGESTQRCCLGRSARNGL